MHIAWALCASVAAFPATGAAQQPRLTVELEPSLAWQSYNDVEIPNDGSATRFSLRTLAGPGPWPAGRLYLTWGLSERHALRLLVAPFSLSETARETGPVRFAGTSYEPDQPLDVTYTFNSYRLSYRWRFFGGARSEAWVGFTAKLRDATIALAQGERASRKDDLGFVPLLHLDARRQLTGRLVFDLDADGLAGGPGRAVDASIKVGYLAGPRWSVHAGYRTVEGGADVSDVYTFAWIHYAVLSLRAGL